MPRQSFTIQSPFSSHGNCAECREEILHDNPTEIEDGLVCVICEDTLDQCEKCDHFVLDGTLNSVDSDNEEVCNSCFNKHVTDCDRCDSSTYNNNLTNVQGDDICKDCVENNTFYCDCCCERYFNSYYGENGECEGCTNSEETSSYVLSSSTKNEMPFRGNGPRFLGVELEVECEDDCLDSCAEYVSGQTNDFAILKEDGSLNNGFEIVTCPADLDSHSEMWARFFANTDNDLTIDSGDCGMHVHVSRKAFTRLDIAKVMLFLNDPNNEGFIRYVAGRYDDSFAKVMDVKEVGKAVKEHSTYKYRMVHLCRETVEFRLFSSTLKGTTFFERLEFVDALCAYVKVTAIKELSVEGFYVFVSNKKEYSLITAKLNTYV